MSLYSARLILGRLEREDFPHRGAVKRLYYKCLSLTRAEYTSTASVIVS